MKHIKGQWSLEKNSFTLIEIVITLIIVSIILTIFLKLQSSNNQFEQYLELQSISNKYKQSNTIQESEHFKLQ